MPLEDMYSLVDTVRERLAPFGSSILVTGYGHVGDGNLHLNIADGQQREGKVCARFRVLILPTVERLRTLASTPGALPDTNLCSIGWS
jgi:FAD/FMN-containing dehydrogenase